MRSDNTGRILANTQPVHDTYPFGNWETPQFLIDRQAPRIPDALPPGDYAVALTVDGGTARSATVHAPQDVVTEVVLED